MLIELAIGDAYGVGFEYADASKIGGQPMKKQGWMTTKTKKKTKAQLIAELTDWQQREQSFRTLAEQSPDLIARFDRGLRHLYVNPALCRTVGLSFEDYLGKTNRELGMPAELIDLWDAASRQVFETGQENVIVFEFETMQGSRVFESRIVPEFTLNRTIETIIGFTRDITKPKQTEEALKRQTETLQTLIDNIPIMLAFFDAAGRFLLVNREWERVLGWTFAEIKDRTDILDELYPDPDYRRSVLAVRLAENPGWHEFKTTTRDGYVLDIAWTSVHLSDGTNIGIGQDISEFKQIREQLYQSQKMESIGRLAGGIAHDFNNILVPIIGYAELGIMRLTPKDKLYANLSRIKQAAERAADLTRQILAFSRRQVMEMRVLDLNEVIAEFKVLLQRLIGEDIELRTILSPALYQIKADKSQLEQVLLNLVVNARDAMPVGGKLIIETDNVYLDERYAAKHADTQPGQYVMLAVSDTGHGMDAETQQRIFDPFFTTKGRGKGTGLGLATVFGIVKQHQGNIWVYSEPGSGTTFKIYLPQSTDVAQSNDLSIGEFLSVYGTETVLVVEDEEMVRKLVCETLEAHGYQVIEATSPEHCLQLIVDFKDTIHLLVTDVIMPGLNGQELYQKLIEFQPDGKVLYMSGYTDNVIVHHNILDEGVNFLQKPFTVHDLMQKVRKVLS